MASLDQPASSRPGRLTGAAKQAFASATIPASAPIPWWSHWTFAYVTPLLAKAQREGRLDEHDAAGILPADLDAGRLAEEFELCQHAVLTLLESGRA
ncbi:hypothetical protein GPECTOR_432g306 [Gonium pectorale]|uniref:Uncharacterized protein n=1 Tax=Gonium pectorale TaxID=33097 RepID=A0A150FV60_GONPE|nr:hypothetical protein GPECTOR_432g306 [Gonium pectorale]|eukprot:KXZ41494.1 hypothetical protein GPECTOR_432g306 [Gonium pectorale]